MKKELRKEIYRSKNNYILMGVCAGLADFFEIDPTLVRIIFIILTFGGGSGILIYIFLALITPLESGKNNSSVDKEIETEKVEIKERKRLNFLGVALLATGVLLLWNHFFPFKIVSEIFWPTIMIIVGLWLVLRD